MGEAQDDEFGGAYHSHADLYDQTTFENVLGTHGDAQAHLHEKGVLGLGTALVGIPAQTTIQEDTPEELMGKVFGLQNNLVNIALSLPLVLAGTLVGSVGLQPVLLLLALLVFAGAGMERPWQRN